MPSLTEMKNNAYTQVVRTLLNFEAVVGVKEFGTLFIRMSKNELVRT